MDRRTSVPSAARVDVEPAADEQRPLAHAAEPGGVVGQRVGMPAPVVADDELDGVGGRAQRDDDAATRARDAARS